MKPAFVAWMAAGAGLFFSVAAPAVVTPGRFVAVAPCPFVAPGSALAGRLTCGYLDVPQDYTVPQGSRMQLPVAVIRASGAARKADPVVFLHGGPGGAPLESPRTLERFAVHPFAGQRDIILFNQRGSAQTGPAFACEALRGGRTAIYAADITLAERDARVADAAIACLREIAGQGRDLAAYGARDSARDLRALRVALGIREWNLLAVSYGTLIALEAARIDRRGVRSLILDTIVSPTSDVFLADAPRNFSQGLDRLLAACAADAACKQAFPDLARRLWDLLAALDARPVTVTVEGAPGEAPVGLVVNWHDFLGLLHWMLYNARTLALVPVLIEATADGDPRLLTRLMDRVFPAPRNGPQGTAPVFFATACRDQFSPRHPRLPLPGNPDYRGFSIVSFMEAVCGAMAPTPRLARPAPLRSFAPALLLSGAFDPMTPWQYAREVARTLPHALRVVIPDAGHSTLSDFEACQTRLAVAFLDDPKAVRGDACGAGPGPRFVTSRDAALAGLR
ncbi:MAG: alpha/beta fold hydrolase [Steroidobacteraceae bacterium]